MAQRQIQLIFDEAEIRNTSENVSSLADNEVFTIKTVIIHNSLNKDVSLQCEGSLDGTGNWFDVGSAMNVTAQTNSFQTCDSFIPFFRVTATCSEAPSSGTLTVAVCRVSGGGNMGSLDKPVGSDVKRKIKIVDASGQTAAQLENAYNTNYGQKGWRLIGFVTISSKVYIVAEKEL